MKNKIFAILLALTLVLALAACHKTENVEVSTTAPVVTEEVETTAAEETSEAEEESKTADKTVIKNDVNLVGTWDDKMSQRATMEIRGGKGKTYQIHVHWGSTAFESDNWTMTGTFNDTTGELTYKDCKRVTTTLNEEDGPETEEVHYTNGTGKFLYKNGELSWRADNDPDVNDCVFAR